MTTGEHNNIFNTMCWLANLYITYIDYEDRNRIASELIWED